MKTVTYKLTLEFSEKISSDNDLEEIAKKVVDALKHECDAGNGLAPENGDAYTKSISVVNEVLGVDIFKPI